MCGEWQLWHQIWSEDPHAFRKDKFLQVSPCLIIRPSTGLAFCSLALRQGEILRQESIHLPLLSPEYRSMFYSSPTLLLRCVTEELGSDWLRKQMESKSKPESVWVMTDRLWAGGDEAGTKTMHMERLGELRVSHKLTWKASWALHLRAQAQTHVCPHTRTRISLHSCCL